jgi:hypothetical protein
LRRHAFNRTVPRKWPRPATTLGSLQPDEGGEFDVLVENSLVLMADREILRLIVAGELPPAERLFEARLSERLGISRPSLREPMRMLAEWDA